MTQPSVRRARIIVQLRTQLKATQDLNGSLLQKVAVLTHYFAHVEMHVLNVLL